MAVSQQAALQEWFKIADADKDGAIAGGEAVQFFSRSGLDNATLSQIWEVSSGGAAKLNQAQFAAAVRLVALAQTQGGRLDVAQARVVMAGMGPALPLPRMVGLEQYAEPPKASGPGAAFATAGYAPQMTGAAAPAGYAPQFTGAGYRPGAPVAGPTGAPVAGPTGAGASPFPPATPADLQRYAAAFQQLDFDRDGLVQGADCSTYFLQWGLDKQVLKHIWDLVAGNSPTLNQQQLTSCLYLMDAAKRGIRPPVALPPGPFPPVSQFGGAGAAASAPAASQQAFVPPAFPTMPTRFNEPDGAGDAAAAARASQVPNLQPQFAGLDQGQRDTLAKELKEAAAKESTLFTVEDRAAATKARIAAFNAAMQEVTMFKSRTDVAMLQAQDLVSRLEEELVVTRAKYDKSFAAAQAQGETSKKLREYLGKLMADKTEQEGRLLQLEAEIAAANAVTPADVQRMEAEVHALHARIAEQEALANAKGSQLGAIRQQRTALEAKLNEVRAAASAANDEVQSMQRQVSELQAAISTARSAGSEGGGAANMASLLSKAAQLYRSLYSSTTKTGGEVPFDALPTNLNLACWMDDAMEGVVDWNDLDDEARGYVLVNAMPGQRIQLEKNKAHAAQGAGAGQGDAAAAAATAPPAAEAGAATAAAAAASPAAPSAPATTAEPAPAAAAAGTGPAPMAVDAFGEAPAFGDAPAFGAAPAAAAPPMAAAAPAAAPTATPAPPPPTAPAPAAGGFGDSAFGDNAFGEAPAFPTTAAAPQPAVPATAAAPPPAAGHPPPAVASGFDDAPAF